MPSITPFPRDTDELAILHEQIANALEHGLCDLGDVFERTFGKHAAHTALRALLVDSREDGPLREQLRAECDRLGWRVYLEEKSNYIDTIAMTQEWRDGAEYAGQGIAPRETYDSPVSLDDRRRRVEALIAHGQTMLAQGARLFGDEHLDIWKGVAARAAIDFGGTLTLEGVHLLSGVSLSAIRNAVSLGELQPDAAGNIAADQASAWLERRREFCPSRWTNPNDRQETFDIHKVVKPDVNGAIFVPQDADGTPFTPEYVVRLAKTGPGLSITVGAKGEEKQYHDFYEALVALAKMDVARWRRRNSAGNWGIVRARSPWVAVSKAEIDRQLAAKQANA